MGEGEVFCGNRYVKKVFERRSSEGQSSGVLCAGTTSSTRTPSASILHACLQLLGLLL